MLRFALLRSALHRNAPRRIASLNIAPLRFARVRFAPLRFALLKFARLRSASLRSMRMKFAPEKSGQVRPFHFVHAFHARTPFLSFAKCAGFAMRSFNPAAFVLQASTNANGNSPRAAVNSIAGRACSRDRAG